MNTLLIILAILALSSASAFALESSLSSVSGSLSSNSGSDSAIGNESSGNATGATEIISVRHRLSASEIAAVASRAGFADEDLRTAIAVALAESGGDPDAYNAEIQAGTPSGLGSVGLWQIYQFKHPEFASEDLTDPQTNGNAAFAIYSDAGNSFRPWATYNSRAYLVHFAEAQAAVNA